MIVRLIIKHLYAHKKIILLGLFAHLVAANVLLYRYYTWNVYMMYGYMVISFFSVYFMFMEKKGGNEIFTCSLPTNRFSIVSARYLTVLIIALAAMCLWFINAYIADLMYSYSRTHFEQIVYIKVLFMAFLFLTLCLSIFLPACFRFGIMGMIFTFIIALAIAITSIPVIFYPYKRSYSAYFTDADSYLVLVLALVMLTLPLISFLLSVKIYEARDI